jgi:3-methylcrotonyl-CoA carboxylase alpha subunit
VLDSVLIANRGEIACRIARTCKRLGVRTVAVYSDADRTALHVEMADEAYRIGPAPPAQSYLRGDLIVKAAKEAGVDAIHPGYGFLAENPAFARRCVKEGLVFVGPPAEAIELLGSKSAAIQTMRAAGIPVLEGYHAESQDDETLAEAARTLGYPLIIKPRAGGGGRGMRVVEQPDGLRHALAGAQREAQSAFGDPRLMLERYVTHARHIEVQTFADTHGNVTHLFERDCSLQRRHQKIIEEAPAPSLCKALRTRLHEAAVKATSAAAYVGAGTVEFLVEGDRARFYFIEMNTRLQVEHPVTEMLTDTDLVEWQLRVAAGETLPTSNAVVSSGHVVEARIYAEQPERGFLPSTGRLSLVDFAGQSDKLRVETGVRASDTVESFYDPLLAKLIAWGPDRSQAVQGLIAALDESRLEGVKTNLRFLTRLLTHPGFLSGELDTSFVDRHLTELLCASDEVDDELLSLACLYRVLNRAKSRQGEPGKSEASSPWATTTSWRLMGDARETLEFVHDDVRLGVTIEHEHPGLVVRPDTRRIVVTGHLHEDNTLQATVDGERVVAKTMVHGSSLLIKTVDKELTLHVYDPLSERFDASADDGHLKAPLPGTVAAIYVQPGDRVERGQAVLAVEAMKMEHVIRAPMAGVVEILRYEVGDRVDEHDELAVLGSSPT